MTRINKEEIIMRELKGEKKVILEYLKRGYKLTCAESIRLGYSYNLRSRISDLVLLGYRIERRMIEVIKKSGEKARVNEYWLKTIK
jgi:hypothetical protein